MRIPTGTPFADEFISDQIIQQKVQRMSVGAESRHATRVTGFRSHFHREFTVDAVGGATYVRISQNEIVVEFHILRHFFVDGNLQRNADG